MSVSFGTAELMSVAATLGWASGLRLYAVLFLTGLAGRYAGIVLPEGLHWLMHPLVLGASGLMLLVEFLADKIPGLDSFWDMISTLVRVPAGAALAAAVFGGDEAGWAAAAAVLGGSLAATAHAAKSATRAAVNASPEPFSNWGLSLAGDALVPSMLWLVWRDPVLAALVLGLLTLAMLLLLWRLAWHLRALAARLRRALSGAASDPVSPP